MDHCSSKDRPIAFPPVNNRTRDDFVSILVIDRFLLAVQPPLGVVFYSPLVGFSLLAYEVS